MIEAQNSPFVSAKMKESGRLCLIAITSANASAKGIRRLDGSQIAPEEIDGKVLRLMKAADVTGVALAILNDGQISNLESGIDHVHSLAVWGVLEEWSANRTLPD